MILKISSSRRKYLKSCSTYPCYWISKKKGFHHIHIIIILQEGYKILSKDQFDRYVSVELPDKKLYPDLYELVVKNMIHGSCGKFGSTKSYIVNDKCKFHYPRAFCSQTLQGKDGYQIYRKKANGSSVKIKKKIIDKRWIAPYNPYLLT